MPRKTTLATLAADRPRLTRLLALVLGMLTTCTFAPFGLWFFAPLLLLPLMYVAITVAPRDTAMHFFWFGMGLFLTGTYWIYISVSVFGQAPVWISLSLLVALALIMSGWLWLAGWSTAQLAQGEPWLLLGVAPAVWTLVEWLRGWVFSGFPWLSLGYAQIDSPLAGWAPVAGVYAVTFALLVSTCAVIVMLQTRRTQRVIALALVIAPWLLGAILKTLDWTEAYGEPIRATLVQGGIPQDRKWQSAEFKPTLDYYRGATLSAPDSQIVVWPEVAIPAVDDEIEPYLKTIAKDALAASQTIVLGVLERRKDRDQERIYNSLLLLDGKHRQYYRKRHLVPYGEYFPVPAFVRQWMRAQNLPHSDLAAGDDRQPLLTAANGARLASAICYEDAYGAEQRYAWPNADLLVNVSNDAWFGDSIAPHQHLEIARMRALEAGRDSIRATNTGISAFIGADGKVIATGAQFQPLVLTRDIERRRGTTPYASQGNRVVVLFCLAALLLSWVAGRGRFL